MVKKKLVSEVASTEFIQRKKCKRKNNGAKLSEFTNLASQNVNKKIKRIDFFGPKDRLIIGEIAVTLQLTTNIIIYNTM